METEQEEISDHPLRHPRFKGVLGISNTDEQEERGGYLTPRPLQKK
jgi:hypothetical protein